MSFTECRQTGGLTVCVWADEKHEATCETVEHDMEPGRRLTVLFSSRPLSKKVLFHSSVTGLYVFKAEIFGKVSRHARTV